MQTTTCNPIKVLKTIFSRDLNKQSERPPPPPTTPPPYKRPKELYQRGLPYRK